MKPKSLKHMHYECDDDLAAEFDYPAAIYVSTNDTMVVMITPMSLTTDGAKYADHASVFLKREQVAKLAQQLMDWLEENPE